MKNKPNQFGTQIDIIHNTWNYYYPWKGILS